MLFLNRKKLKIVFQKFCQKIDKKTNVEVKDP